MTIERRVVRQVNIVSVARIAFALSVTMLAVIGVGLFALYSMAKVSGALESVEGFLASFGLSDSSGYELSFLKFLPGFVLVALVLSVVATAIATAAAALYNAVADVVGGVEVVSRER